MSETELPVSIRKLKLFLAIDTLMRGRLGTSSLTLYRKLLFTTQSSVCVSALEEILIGCDVCIAMDCTSLSLEIFGRGEVTVFN